MRRRARVLIFGALAAVVLVVVGGFAFFALTGDDAPPPPRLEGRPAARTAAAGEARLRPVAPAGSFVGYRVDEEYLGVGVRTAVGRTSAVDGAVTLAADRIAAADLRADMTQLRSDQSRRDDALRQRGIETDRYPGARFSLAAPFALAAAPRRVKGTLTLHGRRAPIIVSVRGQRVAGGRIELVGSAPIRLAAFSIQPPSVAGLVTVRDHGLLEFRLVLGPG